MYFLKIIFRRFEIAIIGTLFFCTGAIAADHDAIRGEWANIEFGCDKVNSNSEYSGALIEISATQFDRDEYPCSILKSKRSKNKITLNLRCSGEEGDIDEQLEVFPQPKKSIKIAGVGEFVKCASDTTNNGYIFANSPASEKFSGNLKLPNFAGRDRAFKQFRTRIISALKEGPNFAGKYSVVQIGCGTTCLYVLIADNDTGQVFEFSIGNKSQKTIMSIEYRPNSDIIYVKWMGYPDGDCFSEYIKWRKGKETVVEKLKVGTGLDLCS